MFSVRKFMGLVCMVIVTVGADAHPPTEKPQPYSWIPRNLIVRDAIYAASAVVDDVTLTGEILQELTGGEITELHSHAGIPSVSEIAYATDILRIPGDRGPGFWGPDADIFSATFGFYADKVLTVSVNGVHWPDGLIEFSTTDSSPARIDGFMLRRSSQLTSRSTCSSRVTWLYGTYGPFPDCIATEDGDAFVTEDECYAIVREE